VSAEALVGFQAFYKVAHGRGYMASFYKTCLVGQDMNKGLCSYRLHTCVEQKVCTFDPALTMINSTSRKQTNLKTSDTSNKKAILKMLFSVTFRVLLSSTYTFLV